MPWGVVAAAVVGAYGANQQAGAAKDSANAAQNSANAEVRERQRQYDQSREDMMPWLDAGRQSLGQLSLLASGDMRGFYNSPEYAFTRDQGLQSLERGAASRGGMYSGGADADRMKFASGLASQEFGNHWNRLSGLAGTGQTAASGLGSLGASMANGNAQSMNLASQARQSSYGQIANANSQFAAGVGGAFNNWYQNNSANNGGGSGWYLGNNPGKG